MSMIAGSDGSRPPLMLLLQELGLVLDRAEKVKEGHSELPAKLAA
jgi:hypothetical protein